MASRLERGVTLVEIAIVVVIIGVMAAIATPALRDMQSDQALRSGARTIADALMLARAHSIKTGNNMIVVFQNASGSASPAGLTSSNTIDIIDDGVAATADCAITAPSEVVWSFSGDQINNLNWGTTPSLANTTTVPTDLGFAPSNNDQGSTFTDASVSAATLDINKFASWIVFQPDGVPRLMTPGDCANLGTTGQGGGGIYFTNGRRDYAIVLSALGTTRVHYWNGTTWIQ